MRIWSCMLALWLTMWLPARADDALAKQRFEEGVAAASENRWDEAARLLEASLRESDKPATRFNLVLAHRELKRPLDVARHALAFLAAPSNAARESAYARALELLKEAATELTTLETGALPQGVELTIDGQPPSVMDGPRVYVLPGVHYLELRLGQQLAEGIEIALSAGQTLPWPRLGRARPEVAAVGANASANSAPKAAPAFPPSPKSRATNDAMPLALLRRRTAWTLGAVGAALSVAAGACLWVADARADKLAQGGIDRSQQPGYFSASDRYWDSLNPIMPLSLTGGALMAASIVVGDRIMRRGSLAWSIASLVAGGALLGAGMYWLVREPGAIVPTSELVRPSRQAGSLLLSAGLPLVTYGIAFPVTRKRDARLGMAGLSSMRISW